jgi:hypothetical protein
MLLNQGCQMVYFQTKNPIFEGLAMEGVGISYVHLVYYTAIWYICGYLVGIFLPFGYVVPRKIWQP